LVTAHSGAGARGELTLQPPRLTFACELDPAQLADLFADSAVIDDLLALGARVALMCSDFSDERAGVVRRLNAAGVPVVGVPLLPLAEGYYFTADNADVAAGSYHEWTAWTRRHGLAWDGVGLDIEPDAAIYLQIMDGPWGWCRCSCRGWPTGRGRPGLGPPTGRWWNKSMLTAGGWRTTSSR
jgi:hypothetical protein